MNVCASALNRLKRLNMSSDWFGTLNGYRYASDRSGSDISRDGSSCDHGSMSTRDDGEETCRDCGVVVGRRFPADSRYAAACEYPREKRSRSSRAGPKRRVVGEKSVVVFSDLPASIDDETKHLAKVLYKLVTAKRLYRGPFRKAVLAACLHRAGLIRSDVRVTLRLILDFYDRQRLTTNRLNKAIAVVSVNVDGEYSVPFFHDSIEIESIFSDQPAEIRRRVSSVYSVIRRDCDEIAARSQLKSVVCACLWFVLINRTNDDTTTTTSFKEFASRYGVSVGTVSKKYGEIKRFTVRRVVKKLFARFLTGVFAELGPLTDEERTLTVHDHHSPEEIRVIANDGFEYPVDDVDDVEDWNIFLSKRYTYASRFSPKTVPLRVRDVKTDVNVFLVDDEENMISSDVDELLIQEMNELFFGSENVLADN